MSPDFVIGGQVVTIDCCPGRLGQVIYPRVRIGRGASQELQKFLGGLAIVNYDPSATFISISPRSGVEGDLVIKKICDFLGTSRSMWFSVR